MKLLTKYYYTERVSSLNTKFFKVIIYLGRFNYIFIEDKIIQINNGPSCGIL